MKRLLLLILAAMLHGSSVAEEAKSPVLTGPMDQSSAETDWRVLSTFIASQMEPTSSVAASGDALSSVSMSGDAKLIRCYSFWREYTLQMIANLGVAYSKKYPSSAHRDDWFQFVVAAMPEHSNEASFYDLDDMWKWRRSGSIPSDAAIVRRDLNANAWKKEFDGLRRDYIADMRNPAVVRAKLEIYGIYEDTEIYERNGSRGTAQQWESIGNRLADFGERYSATDALEKWPEMWGHIRHLANLIRERASAASAKAGEDLTERFLNHGGAILREFAGGDSSVDELRRTPIDMHFTAIDGRIVDVAAMKGKLILIYFMGIRCSACEVMAPLLEEVYKKYHDQGFEVVCIDWEFRNEPISLIVAKAKKNGLNWPTYYDGKAVNPYAKKWGFTGVPQYLLIGRDGLLVAHTLGSGGLTNLEEVVRSELGLNPLTPSDIGKLLGGK